MKDAQAADGFAPINRAYGSVFQPGRLTIGLVAPLEAHRMDPVPSLERHRERAKLADDLGFAALWLRDVPFNAPSFGDAGRVFDPFVYLGALAAVTSDIALGVAGVILPLRHPAHVAKAAASADVLSGGRLLLGVASGDRPEECPALAMGFEDRGEGFRDSFAYFRAMAETRPQIETAQGALRADLDMLPKLVAGRVPLRIAGASRRRPDWLAENGDGWMTYPRDVESQRRTVGDYRARTAAACGVARPVMQSHYVDLAPEPDAGPTPIHFGFRAGADFLRRYVRDLAAICVNHVALNLRVHPNFPTSAGRSGEEATHVQHHPCHRRNRRDRSLDRPEAC